MGTIASRDCLRVLELTEQVAAALLIAVRQGVFLRMKLNPTVLPEPSVEKMLAELSQDIDEIVEDRRLEPDLRKLLEGIRNRAWNCYD